MQYCTGWYSTSYCDYTNIIIQTVLFKVASFKAAMSDESIKLSTERGGRIGRALVSRVGDHGFKSQSSQTTDL